MLIHTWSITEIAARTFQDQSTGLVGKIQIETKTKFLFQPTRMEAVTRMISENGNTEIREAIDYVYSIAEYDRMLSDEGIIMSKIYSIPEKKEFTIGDPRAYLIARKP